MFIIGFIAGGERYVLPPSCFRCVFLYFVSAPTGGGKTVLFELGLIDVLKSAGHQSDFKCVYVAPTKVRYDFNQSHLCTLEFLLGIVLGTHQGLDGEIWTSRHQMWDSLFLREIRLHDFIRLWNDGRHHWNGKECMVCCQECENNVRWLLSDNSTIDRVLIQNYYGMAVVPGGSSFLMGLHFRAKNGTVLLVAGKQLTPWWTTVLIYRFRHDHGDLLSQIRLFLVDEACLQTVWC